MEKLIEFIKIGIYSYQSLSRLFVIKMKVFYLFWTLLLFAATIEQPAFSNWSIEPAENSTNIMTEFGLTKINGTCRWMKTTNSKFYSIAIDLYNQVNSTDDYVSMAVYFREDVSGFPFHSQNVSVIYRHMINGKMVKQFADTNIKILAVIQGHSLTIIQRNGDKIKMLLIQKLGQSHPTASNTTKKSQYELSAINIFIFTFKACLISATAHQIYHQKRLPLTLLHILTGWECVLVIAFHLDLSELGISIPYLIFQNIILVGMLSLIPLSAEIFRKYIKKSKLKSKADQQLKRYCFKSLVKLQVFPLIWFLLYLLKGDSLIVFVFSLLPLMQIIENTIWKQKQMINFPIVMLYWINLLHCFCTTEWPASIREHPINNYLCGLVIILGLGQTVALQLQNRKIPRQKFQAIKFAGAQNINPAGEICESSNQFT